MRSHKSLYIISIACIIATSLFTRCYAMVTTRMLVKIPTSDNQVDSDSQSYSVRLAVNHSIEEILQRKITTTKTYSLKTMHPIVLSDYYARILPYDFERFILDVKTMTQRSTRRSQFPTRYVLVTKDTHDARTTIQSLSTQSDADYLAVNIVSDLNSYDLDEINRLFSGICDQAKKSGRPVVLFMEEADFLLNNNQEPVTGIDVPALLYAIANYGNSEYLAIVIHIKSSQNINKSLERYLDCSWLFLPPINFDFRLKIATALFNQCGITIDDDALNLLASRTEGCTIAEMRDIIARIIVCAHADDWSVKAEDIDQYCLQPMRSEESLFKRLNFNSSCYGAILGGVGLLGVIGVVSIRHVLKKAAAKRKKTEASLLVH